MGGCPQPSPHQGFKFISTFFVLLSEVSLLPAPSQPCYSLWEKVFFGVNLRPLHPQVEAAGYSSCWSLLRWFSGLL